MLETFLLNPVHYESGNSSGHKWDTKGAVSFPENDPCISMPCQRLCVHDEVRKFKFLYFF